MNNKIVKFRAYSHKHKKIFEIGSIEFGDVEECEGCNILVGDREAEWLNKGTFDLLQFSGIKDKHGKEIFEGFLVKDFLHNLIYEIHWVKNGLAFGKTIINKNGTKGHTTYLSDLYNDVSATPDVCEDVEIIGDVFSPEISPKKALK